MVVPLIPLEKLENYLTRYGIGISTTAQLYRKLQEEVFAEIKVTQLNVKSYYVGWWVGSKVFAYIYVNKDCIKIQTRKPKFPDTFGQLSPASNAASAAWECFVYGEEDFEPVKNYFKFL